MTFFDLDGTLIDSNNVRLQIDLVFWPGAVCLAPRHIQTTSLMRLMKMPPPAKARGGPERGSPGCTTFFCGV